MQLREFDSHTELAAEAERLIRAAFCSDRSSPFGVMLSGGRTPIPLYRSMAAQPPTASRNLHLLLSDERMVPFDSPESNYGLVAPMAEAMQVDGPRVIRVNTSLPLDEAAAQYDSDVAEFLGRGPIALSVLGMGPDGHTASLFPGYNLADVAGRHAVPVVKEQGPDRVSVTPLVLCAAERTVILAAGADKSGMVEKLMSEPESIMAGRALAGAENIEVWYSSNSD